ncbi:hypothetical protein [Klebsiella variicola]|uniref:hypothetical protein n=1 Tax=Klebsiella variicola TaxID=244366 RepID=UPI003A4DACFC
MLLKKDLKWSPDGIQIINIPAGEYEAGSLLSALLRLLLKWGFLTALNNRKLKQRLSLKSVISGVKANEALCK